MGSVPKMDRGFANGTIQVSFNLGHMTGISFGTAMMTLIYQHQTGQPGVASTDNPAAFVTSLNYTFTIALCIMAFALATSLLRGKKQEEENLAADALEKSKT